MLSPGLSLCPKEAALVGAMVVNYGELEFCLAQCLGAVLDNNILAVRLVFRDQGESRRINLCDTLMRPRFKALGLESVFAETMDQVRFCKIIRNQYAHGWFSWSAFTLGYGEDPKQRSVTLKIVSLEDAVDRSEDVRAEAKNLPLTLLEDRAAYFVNAQDWIMWLQSEASRALFKDLEPVARPARATKPARWAEQ